MKKAAFTTAIAFLAATALSGTALAADAAKKEQQQSQSMSQSGQTSSQQIRTASDLQKFDVQTAQGEKIGKVDKVVIDMQQGQIAYVTLSGKGMDNVIVPWKALKAQPQQQTLALSKSDMNADKLKQAPKGDIQQLSRDQGRQIHQFFGVAPYWESGGQSSQSGQGSMQERSGGSMSDQERSQPEQRQQSQPGRGM